MTFCPSCGGPGICRDDCQATTPRARWAQRQAWVARVMLDTTRLPESRVYYDEQLMKAEAVIEAEARWSLKQAA